MNFNFLLANHGPRSQETLRDILDPLRFTLQTLGHKVSVTTGYTPPDTTHLLVDYFADPGFLDYLQAASMPFGIIATEWYDGEGFNGQRGGEWDQRFRGFVRAARMAKFMWALLPETATFASTLTRAAWLDTGYVPEMTIERSAFPPVYDFGLCGVRTPERQKLLDDLCQTSKAIWVRSVIREDRDDEMAMCKWALGLLPSLDLPYPSATRLTSALYTGVPLVLQPPKKVTPLYMAINADGFGLGGAAHELWDLKSATRAALDCSPMERNQIHHAQLDGFKRYPMLPLVERALDLTLTNQPAAGAPSP